MGVVGVGTPKVKRSRDSDTLTRLKPYITAAAPLFTLRAGSAEETKTVCIDIYVTF